MNTPTTDTAPRVCACLDCLGTAPDASPLCDDCTRLASPATIAAWIAARAELRAAVAAGNTNTAAVWMLALLDCERDAVRAAMGRARTLPADGYTGPLLHGACA